MLSRTILIMVTKKSLMFKIHTYSLIWITCTLKTLVLIELLVNRFLNLDKMILKIKRYSGIQSDRERQNSMAMSSLQVMKMIKLKKKQMTPLQRNKIHKNQVNVHLFMANKKHLLRKNSQKRSDA